MKPFDLNNLPAGLAGSTQDANTTQLFESARWSWRIAGLALLVLAVLCPPVRSTASAIAAGACAAQDDYEKLEAVLETSRGQIVLEFFPREAPKHVDYFIKTAREGGYDGTTFHRVVKNGLIQGGDPLSKSPAAKARYGTGGLNAGLPDEVNFHKHISGAVSGVLQAVSAGSIDVKPGTSGAQFFIVLNAGEAQARLDPKFTVFARVVEGMDAAQAISTAPASAAGVPTERITINKVIVREKSPTVEQMKTASATIETSLGNLKIQFLSDAAPNTTRSFIRNARSGLYDGTTFFRISQKYFVEGGYLGDWPQDSPNRKRIFSLWQMPAEKSEAKQTRGVISMRKGQDETTGWYFFTIATDNPALDGKHVPFAKIVEGLDVLDKIASAEVEGDKPKQRIEIKKITVQ
ncbi:MAG TPA: peptidylprolyl isomerase [Blastocatellia bacterium]|nr:peptidylprolyl isomerase [Blastocatellia bacterium]